MKLEVEGSQPQRPLKGIGGATRWGPGGESAGETPVFVRVSENWEAKAMLLIVSGGRGYVRFLPGITTGWVSLDRITPRD